MRRRSRAGGEPIKTRRRRAATPKRRNAPKGRRGPSTIKLQERLKMVTRELNETREREDATSEVLRVISRSSGELRPVFDAILDNAVRICGAQKRNFVAAEGWCTPSCCTPQGRTKPNRARAAQRQVNSGPRG